MLSFAQLVALASTILLANGAAVPSTCTRQYTVKLGDNCNAIAAEQGVSTYVTITTNLRRHRAKR